jgi:MarR family transcriptional regulator, organic hydroperoxide resistance regulator
MDQNFHSRLAGALNRIYRKLDLYQDENMQIDPKEQLILLLVEESGLTRIKEIASKITLPLSTISWTVDRMVQKGYLRRGEDPNDRRAVMIELDTRGKKALAKYHEVFQFLAAEAAARLTPEQFESILSIVETLADSLGNQEK